MGNYVMCVYDIFSEESPTLLVLNKGKEQFNCSPSS